MLAEIIVRGAASEAEARAIAERIATSPLVKTALHGHDANWGRIALRAAGSARWNDGYARARPGQAHHRDRRRPRPALRRPGPATSPRLPTGTARSSSISRSAPAARRTSRPDLSSDYVRINAAYRS